MKPGDAVMKSAETATIPPHRVQPAASGSTSFATASSGVAAEAAQKRPARDLHRGPADRSCVAGTQSERATGKLGHFYKTVEAVASSESQSISRPANAVACMADCRVVAVESAAPALGSTFSITVWS
jgi:hypothetical protein